MGLSETLESVYYPGISGLELRVIDERTAGRRKSDEIGQVLKVSRLIKRRSVANEACDAGRVLINGKQAKASTNVKKGDVIEIQFGMKTVEAEVLDIQDTTKKEEAKNLFRYL